MKFSIDLLFWLTVTTVRLLGVLATPQLSMPAIARPYIARVPSVDFDL